MNKNLGLDWNHIPDVPELKEPVLVCVWGEIHQAHRTFARDHIYWYGGFYEACWSDEEIDGWARFEYPVFK
jgi:hypothetical protein